MLFNIDEFYPTPKSLIDKLLAGLDFMYIESVLEPSAGKGDIVSAVVKCMAYGHRRAGLDYCTIDCIEINPELQSILKANKHTLVHDDFLTYHTHKRYDLIVMNPPFSVGDLHLLHALELAENGGKIRCILNAETIRNRYTNARKLLWDKLNSYGAQIRFLQGEFEQAERKTSVEVALISVDIPEPERESYIFEQLKKKSYSEVDVACHELAVGDFVAQVVKQYEIEVEAGIRLINEYKAMKPYIYEDIDKDKWSYSTLSLSLRDGKQPLSVNGYVKLVRLKYWRALFNNKQFTGMLTSNLQDELYNRVKELKNYDFSVFNIKQIQLDMLQRLSRGVEDTILDLFDNLSSKHSWYPESENNVHYFNGWASNKAHRINKKVIIPIHGAYAYSYWEKRYEDSFDLSTVYRLMCDLEKTLSYLETGNTAFDADDLHERLKTCQINGKTRNISLRYFNISLFKKGTCHIVFTDLELLDRLNIYGSQRKGWLPPSYGKKQYSNMTDEEKRVVDEFQGEEAYTKVMQNPAQYIIDTPRMMMLTAGATQEVNEE